MNEGWMFAPDIVSFKDYRIERLFVRDRLWDFCGDQKTLWGFVRPGP